MIICCWSTLLSKDYKMAENVHSSMEAEEIRHNDVATRVKVAGNPVFSRSTNPESKLTDFFVFLN